MFIESLKEKSDQNLFQVLGKTGLWIYVVIYFCHGESDYYPTRTASEIWDGISILIFIKLTTEPHLLTSDCSLAIWFRDRILSWA